MSNKTAFNKIKQLLKNKKDWELLEQIAEAYQKNQKNDRMINIDLIEIYLLTKYNNWRILADEIINKHLKNEKRNSNFTIKTLLKKFLELDQSDYAKDIIKIKRQQKIKIE